MWLFGRSILCSNNIPSVGDLAWSCMNNLSDNDPVALRRQIRKLMKKHKNTVAHYEIRVAMLERERDKWYQNCKRLYEKLTPSPK